MLTKRCANRNIQKLLLITRNNLTNAAETIIDESNTKEKVEINDNKPSKILAEPNKRPPGFTPAPYTRTIDFRKKDPSIVHREFLNEGDATGIGPRLSDYYWMQDYVTQLKTPEERIEFVNPYQRPWTRFEKRWHRVFHPMLTAPRRAWCIPNVPKYFDSLDFYKYITKTKLVGDSSIMDGYYSGLVPPTSKFEKRLNESLINYLYRKQNEENSNQLINDFLRIALDDAQISIAHNVDWIQKYRQSTNPRCESFWIRGGFMNLYDKLEIWDDDGKPERRQDRFRFIGDDTRKLGELAFTMRDDFSIQLRAKTTLPQIVNTNDPIVEAPLFPENINISNDVIYSPTQFNLDKDDKTLWICPGYEPNSNETDKFGRLAIKSISELNEWMNYWKIPENTDEYDTTLYECLSGTSITSLFNWLNGQAHCLGYTQYNDIEEPLVSQIILSDGKKFFFALGQLNTIAINIEMDGFINKKSNLCLVDGPYNLYDEYDDKTKTFKYENDEGELVNGMNPKVLTRFLQMLMIGR